MKCPHCQSDIPDDLKFCGVCGGALAATRVCPACQFANPANFQFCGQCGNRFTLAINAENDHRIDQPSTLVTDNPEAERRQLTVLFSDLVESTALAEKLDPEDLSELFSAYRSACNHVIKRFDGYIAQYQGDGNLVYFGYPHAHEDDVERAVRTGLGIVETVTQLNAAPEWKNIRLAVRVGIATGLVVMRDRIVEWNSKERFIVGQTLNLAARIQQFAKPNGVVITPRVRRHLRGLFEYKDLGVQRLKGFSYPLRIWHVLKAEQVASRFEAAHPTRLSPTVNRKEEIAILLRCWQKAKQSEGQVVLLAGASGIGKSHIIEALMERIIQEPHTRFRFQCSPYFSNTAFYPVINQFERVAGFQRDDSAEHKLHKLAQMLDGSVKNLATTVPLFAALLSIPTGNQYPPLDVSPQRQKELMFSALREQLDYYQRHKPTLIICEDLHWIDPSSQELLSLLVAWTSTARSIVFLTSRDSFPTSWIEQRHVTLLALNRLTSQESKSLAKNITSGKALPESVLQELVSKSDGVPLFIEELTKATIYTGLLHEHSDHYELKGSLSVAAIPSTLQDSLTARLDQLSPAKAVAQTASAIGREFSYDLLATVMPLSKTKLLQALNQLIKAEVIFYFGTPPETMYVFKHALLQSAAYDSMVRSKRRLLHRDIGEAIEKHFPEILRKEPELVAHHFSAAGLPGKAVDYWLRAGQASSERSAYVEATRHLEEGLQVLASLPTSPERDQRELALRIALGPALIFTKGAGTQEVEQVYRQSLELCSRLPESSLHFAAYWGWWRISGNFRIMRERAHQLLILSERLHDPGLRLQAHHCQWAVLFHLGDYAGCRTHIEKGLSLYSSGDYRNHASIFGGHDPQVCAYGEQGQALWLLGFPVQAREWVQKALAWAEQLRHSGSIVHALDMTLLVYRYCCEVKLVQAQAERMIQFSEAHGLCDEWAKGTLFRGWAYAMTGQHEKGIAGIQQGLTALSETGTKEDFPIYFDMLADAYQRAGDTEQALSTLAEALIQIKHTKSRYWEAEIHRHRGALLLALPTQAVTEAEACLTKALEIAQRQKAKSLELRAVMSLTELRRQQGQSHQARSMLQSTYRWFTEGFDTVDLKNAATLLSEL